MTHVVLAIDPSVNSSGVAAFVDTILVAAARLPTLKPMTRWASEGERWQAVAAQIVSWCQHRPTVIIYERPQVYLASRSKGDPNDLVPLAAIGAAVAATFIARLTVDMPTILTPTPAEWIGQLPKATRGSAKESPRALRILSRLSEAERLLVPDQHDAVDAVGLGLHALGRLGVRRVLTSG